MKSIFLYFFTKLKSYQKFYLQKMQPLCQNVISESNKP